jgi:hypothetical protein
MSISFIPNSSPIEQFVKFVEQMLARERAVGLLTHPLFKLSKTQPNIEISMSSTSSPISEDEKLQCPKKRASLELKTAGVSMNLQSFHTKTAELAPDLHETICQSVFSLPEHFTFAK